MFFTAFVDIIKETSKKYIKKLIPIDTWRE